MVPLFAMCDSSFNPSNLNFFFTRCSFTYLMLTISLNLPSEPFKPTPNGFTTSGLSSSGRIEIAPAASISSAAEVTKPSWASAEEEFFAILGAGALSIHWSSQPFCYGYVPIPYVPNNVHLQVHIMYE